MACDCITNPMCITSHREYLPLEPLSELYYKAKTLSYNDYNLVSCNVVSPVTFSSHALSNPHLLKSPYKMDMTDAILLKCLF